MLKVQQLQSNQQSKYDEIIEYLKQDNGYWLENDKWDLTKDFFIGKTIRFRRYLDISGFKNYYFKNEIKYYIVFNFKECLLKTHTIFRLG